MNIVVDDAELRRRLAALGRLPADMQERIRKVVDDEALRVQGQAQLKAPVREGALHDSAESEAFQWAGTPGFRVTFGGLAEAYAEVQHEHEEFVHPKGGQAHYLYGGADSAWSGDEQRAFERSLDRALTDAGNGAVS